MRAYQILRYECNCACVRACVRTYPVWGRWFQRDLGSAVPSSRPPPLLTDDSNGDDEYDDVYGDEGDDSIGDDGDQGDVNNDIYNSNSDDSNDKLIDGDDNNT